MGLARSEPHNPREIRNRWKVVKYSLSRYFSVI